MSVFNGFGSTTSTNSAFTGSSFSENTIDVSEACVDAIFEQCLIEEASHFNNDQMKMFLESDLCKTLVTEGKMRKNTIVILSKKDDEARRVKMIAMQLAKEANDPLWEKLRKNRVIERDLLNKIMKKYGSKARKIAKTQQKEWIKERMPANFGQFGGSARLSTPSPAK